MSTVKSQSLSPEQDWTRIKLLLEEYFESIEGDGNFDINTLTEDLVFISKHPININSATEQDLGGLFFLSDTDISSIISHRERYGALYSPYELQTIEGLSVEIVNLLRNFITVSGTPRVRSGGLDLERSNNQLYLKWRHQIQDQRGFTGEDPAYQGDKNYLYTRFIHNTSEERYGFTMEKDAGERLLSSLYATGVDFFSAHYQRRNLTPTINQLNLGDYTVEMGLGLVAGGNFGLGKSSFTTNTKRNGRALRAYSGVAENNAFRGIGADLQLGRQWSTVLFASHTSQDANLLFDDEESVAFSSLQTSGLHRTLAEIDDRNSIASTAYGGILRWKSDKGYLSLNHLSNQFSLQRENNSTPFRTFNWNGDHLSGTSIDAGLTIDGWNLYGEFAYASTAGTALQIGALKSLDPRFDLSINYRNYTPEYQSILGNAFGEGTATTNQEGIYVGFEYRPSDRWQIRGYVDQWRHPWLRSRSDAPTSGRDYLLRVEHEFDRSDLFVLYRYKTTEQNDQVIRSIDFPTTRTIQKIRVHYAHEWNEAVQTRTRVELSQYDSIDEEAFGWLIYQDLLIRPQDLPYRWSARVSYFDIEDFDARIYAYENDLLYEYAIPFFNGRGLRTYLNMRVDINRHLMVEARYERTAFADVESIGSGNSEIKGNVISRVKAQVRFTF
ncbi:MAG: helix-hairpin-helix domain-containing protein [Bacteroidota bacterium]